MMTAVRLPGLDTEWTTKICYVFVAHFTSGDDRPRHMLAERRTAFVRWTEEA